MGGSVLIATLIASLPAAAQEQERRLPVHLEVDPCIDEDVAEVRRIVGIELGAPLATDAAGVTSVTTSCRGDFVLIRVDDPLTGKSLERSIDLLGAAPNARARLLALAMVELVAASWTELESNPEPTVPPAGDEPSIEARQAALAVVRARAPSSPPEHRERRVALFGAASARAFLDGPHVLWGGGIRLAIRIHPWLDVAGDLAAELGSVDATTGSVSTASVSAGAALRLHRRFGRFGLAAGGGGRLGFARLAGSPDDPELVQGGTVRGLWDGLFATAAISAAPVGRLRLELGAEVGVVLRPVRGELTGPEPVAFDGGWITATLSIGAAL